MSEIINSEPTAVGPGSDVQFSWPWPLYTTAWTPVTNGTPAVCISEKSVVYALEVSVLVSAGLFCLTFISIKIAVIIVLLNILLPRCRGRSLWSLLEIVVPVKFLDATPFRFIYCIVMSSLAGDLLKSVSDTTQYYRAEGYAVLDAFDFFVISPSVIILKQTLTYFPILACVDSSVPVIGHTIGFLYTLLMGSHNVYIEYITLTGCSSKGQLTTRDMIISVAVSAPVYINYLITAGWFFFHALLEAPLVLCTRQKCSQNMSGYDRNRPYYLYVKGLFYNRNLKLKVINVDTLWNYLLRGLMFVLPFHPGFSYPLPFLSAVSMATMLIYQLGLRWSYAAVSYTEQLMVYVREFNITVETVERFFPNLKPEVDELFYDAKSLVLAFNIILPICAFIAFAQTLAFVVYMAQHYHKLLRRASQGDLSFLVISEPLPSVPYRIAAMMRYSSFQLSYIVFTWLVFFLMMSSLLSFGLLFYFLFKNFQSFGVHLWAWFMIPMAWGALMHQVQVFLCHFVFLNNKQLSGNGRFVPIRFKSLYQVLSFLFFFFNVIYGFVMSFLRLLGVFIFTVVMLFRMDWDVYMRGLEGWDVGCRTFVGYMYIECTNNNAVVRTFIALLQESTDHSQTSSASLVETSEDSDKGTQYTVSIQDRDRTPLIPQRSKANGAPCRRKNVIQQSRMSRSKQARNRWFVAYTLLRNPSLCAFTSTNLDLARNSDTNQLLVNGHLDYGTFSNNL